MTTVQNPFTESEFTWSPTNSLGHKSKAIRGRYTGTGTLSQALTIPLADKASNDIVVTVQCTGPDGEYFRRDLRGAWFRDDTTVTEQDEPIGFNDASTNEATGYDAVLDLSSTSARIRLLGEGQWSIVGTQLITPRDLFDPLSYGTPKAWVNADDGNYALTGANVTSLTNLVTAGSPASVNMVSSKYPTRVAANADFQGLPTLEMGSDQGFTITGHGITTGPFTVVFVAVGGDNFWLQDANGNFGMSAGGGSGNKLQMVCDATNWTVGDIAKKDVPGVYVAVFNGADSELYQDDDTPIEATAGTQSSLSGVTLTIGGPAGLSGAGLGGSVRHFLLYSGALSPADIAELIAGFQAEVTY